jgi:hypothetical protein
MGNYAPPRIRGNKEARDETGIRTGLAGGRAGLFRRYRKNVIYAGQRRATEALSLFTCGKSPAGPNPGPRSEP